MSCKLSTISFRDHNMTQLLSLMFSDVFHILFSVVAFERTAMGISYDEKWTWRGHYRKRRCLSLNSYTKQLTTCTHHITVLPDRTICREYNWHLRPIMLYGFYCVYWGFRKIIIIISTRTIHRDYCSVRLYVLIPMLYIRVLSNAYPRISSFF